MDELHVWRLRNKGVIRGECLDTGILSSFPVEMDVLCAAIAHRFLFLWTRVDLIIIGPPGDIAAIVRYLTANHLVNAWRYRRPEMFLLHTTLNSHESEPRREFQDKNVLLVTDSLSATNRPTIKEMTDAIKKRGGTVVGIGALVNYDAQASYGVDPKIPIFAAVDFPEIRTAAT